MKHRLWLGFVVVMALLAAGCGSEDEAVSLRLDFFVNGKHAPFFVGVEQGFYADEGITLEIIEGRGSLAAVQALTANEQTFAFADQGAVASTIAGGAEIKTVGVFSQRTPVAAISFEPLSTPTDLYGKDVGYFALGVGTLWESFSGRNELDLDQFNLIQAEGGAGLAAILSGDLDVWIGLLNAEWAAAKVLAPDRELYSLPFADFDSNALAHGVVARQSTIDDDPELVRGFLKATVKAWEYTLGHREEAVAALVKAFPDANAEIVLSQLDISIDLLHTPNTEGRPIGWMSPKDWEATLSLYKNFGGLETDLSSTDFYTNDFLP